jgi:hypothetical protein
MLKSKYTAEDIEIRIWGFVVVCITIILFGIVFVLLYSLIFVVQPIKSMAPLDMQFSKILNDIVLLLVGGIGGIVGKRAVGAVSQAVTPTPPPTPSPAAPAPSMPVSAPTSGALPVWINPPLDETWTPPPPPTTPPEHLEPDHVREEIAAARREAGQ